VEEITMLVRQLSILAVAVTILSLASSSGSFEDGVVEPKLRVAVLHFSIVEDLGWTYEGHLGAEKMAQELPYVELTEQEDAFVGPNTSDVLREYAEDGCDLIFCHSYNFGEAIAEVAPEYPGTIFMWGAGVEKLAPNAGTYFGRMYEVRYLTGIVAGAMTNSGKIGYIAAIPTSEVIRGIDAFARGVSEANPEAKVYIRWVGDWYDPPEERSATISLIDDGCDVLTHHTDSFAPAEVSEERDVFFIGFGSDSRKIAPNVTLTGALWNWAPIMVDIAEEVHNGTWDEYPSQDWWYGLEQDGVKLAFLSDRIPDDVKSLVEEKKAAIAEGEFEVFPGMTDEVLRNLGQFELDVAGA
jgi:basic membrane protein A